MVLSLVFLKFISDKFEARRKQMEDEGQGDFLEMEVFYQQDNIFYLPEEARWSFIKQNAKQDDIAVRIDTALSTIEKRNPSLKGALPDNYFSRQNLETKKLASLIDTIDNIETLAHETDVEALSKETLSVACTNTSSASLPQPKAKAGRVLYAEMRGDAADRNARTVPGQNL